MFNQTEILKEVKKLSINTENKIAVYTAVTNSYDKIWEPTIKSKNIDYFLFTDNAETKKSTSWNIKKINFEYRDPRRLAKIFKILPHFLFVNYRYSIWVDANVEILDNLEDLINIYLEKSNNFISFFNHPKRSCIYDEAKNLLSFGYGDKNMVSNQINHYKSLNYPKNNGLIVGRFIIRKHNNEDCKKLMEKWWKEIDSNSSRDQLSFNFSSWQLGYNYEVININHYDNNYFKIHPHPRIKFYNEKGVQIFNINILKGIFIHFITSKSFYTKFFRKYYFLFKSKF